MVALHDGEQIILLRRRHWLTLVLALVPAGMGILIVLAVPLALSKAASEFFSLSPYLLWFGAVLVTQIFWAVLFLIITDYYLDAWMVTNERLVFVELHGLFRRSVSSIDLTRVQDVTIEVFGILPTFFKYGTIVIHTSGNEQGFRFKDVPEPYVFKDAMLRIRTAAQERATPTTPD